MLKKKKKAVVAKVVAKNPQLFLATFFAPVTPKDETVCVCFEGSHRNCITEGKTCLRRVCSLPSAFLLPSNYFLKSLFLDGFISLVSGLSSRGAGGGVPLAFEEPSCEMQFDALPHSCTGISDDVTRERDWLATCHCGEDTEGAERP